MTKAEKIKDNLLKNLDSLSREDKIFLVFAIANELAGDKKEAEFSQTLKILGTVIKDTIVYKTESSVELLKQEAE